MDVMPDVSQLGVDGLETVFVFWFFKEEMKLTSANSFLKTIWYLSTQAQ